MTGPKPPHTGRTARVDRTVTALLGMLAIAAGAAALLVGAGVFGPDRARRSVIDPKLLTQIEQNRELTLGLAIGLGVVLALLGSWWALREVLPERRPDVALESSPSRQVTITAGALSSAIREDAGSIVGVARTRVRMVGNADCPGLRLTLWLNEGADVRGVWTELDSRVLARARHALDVDVLPAAIRIELDAAERQRVI